MLSVHQFFFFLSRCCRKYALASYLHHNLSPIGFNFNRAASHMIGLSRVLRLKCLCAVWEIRAGSTIRASLLLLKPFIGAYVKSFYLESYCYMYLPANKHFFSYRGYNMCVLLYLPTRLAGKSMVKQEDELSSSTPGMA